MDFDEVNIHATFDALGPDAHNRITMATYAANIEAYYAPDTAGIPGDQLVANVADRGPRPQGLWSAGRVPVVSCPDSDVDGVFPDALATSEGRGGSGRPPYP
ncbi:hypothetical protein ACTU45_33760 [Streptomyces sp. 24-1644]|uniref:hypothetical protein n=1 Tax=Streptomyces sp. 24-1644 TaxID=3457315 RepID=UPI003FA6DE87